MRLCYVLPPPACYIYRDMRPSKMQRLLAQRAMLEKELRGHLVELVHSQQQIRGWVNTVSRMGCVCVVGYRGAVIWGRGTEERQGGSTGVVEEEESRGDGGGG